MTTIDPRAQQATTVIAAGIAVALSWQHGYQPAHRAVVRDREQAIALSANISHVEALVGSAGGEAAWLAHKQEELSRLEARFPRQEQLPQLLNTLVETLKMSEIKLLNVAQGNPEPVQDAGKPLLIKGAPCYRLPVIVTAEGRYRALLAAIEQLTSETFPGVVSVDQVEMQLKEPQGARLGTTLHVYLYVTGTPPLAAPPG